MAKVQLDHTPPIPPYYDVFNVHWAINKEKFYEDAATNPAFEVRLQLSTKELPSVQDSD